MSRSLLVTIVAIIATSSAACPGQLGEPRQLGAEGTAWAVGDAFASTVEGRWTIAARDGESDRTLPGRDAESADAGPSFSFAVFGDNQCATCCCGAGARRAIPKAIVAARPTFVLHTGDLMDHGHEAGAYAKFRSCYQDILARMPFFPTMGNHDALGISSYKTYLEKQLLILNPKAYGSDYQTDFELWYEDDPTVYSTDWNKPNHKDSVPSGVSFETFYAFRHANAYFISFEQGTRWWANTPKTWVEKHLKAARADPTVEHVFVYMHHPMYSTTMKEDAVRAVREHYEPLFRQHGVTAVFSGHAHLYDRFYVPHDGSKTRQDPPPSSYAQDGCGVHYIVTGGGGAAPNPCNLRQQYSYDYFQQRGCLHHFTLIRIAGRQVSVSIVGVQGDAKEHTTSIYDSFVLQSSI